MSEADRIERARFGDRDAFDELVRPALGRLRGVVRRMVGDPDETEDVVQDALLRAYQKLGTFRGGSAFATWLVAIGTRASLDHLRTRKRWRPDAQVHARDYLHRTAEDERAIFARFASPEHRYDAREHIAFCFTCVGRSLEPEEQAALVLRDVLGMSNNEAAFALDVTESVLRHRLAAARTTMQERFDGLCGIVSKQGVCYQCSGLRDVITDDARRGPAVPTLGDDGQPRSARFSERLRVVQDSDIDTGTTQQFHDLVWRAISRVEERRSA